MTSLREWLDSIGLGQYAAAFAEHSIDWDVLPNLNHQVLKDVGVIAAGDRIRLLSAIKDLSSSDSNFEITSSPLDREIVTSKRGKRIATSIDGTLTGLGGNLIIIDDPLKLGDAMSEAVRTRVIEWYRSTLLSRADDKKAGRIVLVMQRVHQAGYLQEQGGFEVLNLPAIAQRNEAYELGDGRIYNRQKGELLHPEQEPADALAELKREMGPIAFSAQYQQSPIPPGGTIIKRKWLTPYDHVDRQPGDRIIMSWDHALSETETGDYSACVVLLRRQEVLYILEVVLGRFPFDALKRKVMEVKQLYGSSTLLIEDSPISRGLIQSLREQSINVTVYKPETDKRARVIAQSDLFAGGSVRFPRRARWLEEFTAELLAFPGRHDDQVDALGAVPDEARFVGDPSRGITEGIINCDVRVSNQLLTIK